VGKPEGKRPLRRPSCKWEDDIKMDLREKCDVGYRLDLPSSGQGAVAGICDCGNELSGSIKRWEFLD